MATATDTGQIARLEAALKVLDRRCADQTGWPIHSSLAEKRRRVLTELATLRTLTERERSYV
jgi:hypothetical protein